MLRASGLGKKIKEQTPQSAMSSATTLVCGDEIAATRRWLREATHMLPVLHAGVPDCELVATALAPDQTGQQRVSTLGRAVMSTSGNVAADHCADRLEPLPAHIPVVGRAAFI